MFNLYNQIKNNPDHYRQLQCGQSLISIYNCPLENKFEDLWSPHNYIVYVVEGRKIWHTAAGSFDLNKGHCVFVRKGASIVEQFFDVRFCLILFFLPDDFITDTLRLATKPLNKNNEQFDTIMHIDSSTAVHAFFQSMMPYFEPAANYDPVLLELKFRELVLVLSSEFQNSSLHSYFQTLLSSPTGISLQHVMEENFRYNMSLADFARLTSRSLSAFKRDFDKLYNTTPGKWLLERRLDHAKYLLTHFGKTVSEAAFESGFESPAHFSRVFRNRFRMAPVALKQA